jgi:hypothetical protein
VTSPTEFRRLALSPVVRKDELEYFREISAGGWRLVPRAPAFVDLPPT